MRKAFDLVREIFPREGLMGLRAGRAGVNQVEREQGTAFQTEGIA